MLLTSIPFFQQVIVLSFRCDHCGTTNNEVQSAGAIRAEGTVYTVRIVSREDLNRQIVRSSSCSINIPEYQLALPANRSQFTTVEGLIRGIVSDLSGDQPLRRVQDGASYAKIHSLIEKLQDHLGDDSETQGDGPLVSAFTIVLDDPSGNSFVEFIGSMADPKWNLKTYARTLQQDVDLGISSPEEVHDVRALEEVYAFPGTCPSCNHSLNTLMQKVAVPHFKVCRIPLLKNWCYSILTSGCLHHVYELRILWIQRQRSQIWICHF
jgi:zinc finger protein